MVLMHDGGDHGDNRDGGGDDDDHAAAEGCTPYGPGVQSSVWVLNVTPLASYMNVYIHVCIHECVYA